MDEKLAVQIITNPALRETSRKKIAAFQQLLASHPHAVFGDSVELPLKHYFADGCYIREIFIPKGSIYVGKIHKHSHPRFLLKGCVEVFTEYDGVVVYTAPSFMITKAGTKRVGFALEDTIIVTVHVTDKTDLQEIETEIIAEDYAAFDASRYLTEGNAVCPGSR